MNEKERWMPKGMRRNTGRAAGAGYGPKQAPEGSAPDATAGCVPASEASARTGRIRRVPATRPPREAGGISLVPGRAEDPEVERRLVRLTRGLAVAVAVAVLSLAVAAYTVVNDQVEDQRTRGSMRTVVVAAEDIPAGMAIGSGMVETASVPVGYLSSGATSDASAFLGEVANVSIPKGTQLVPSLVSGSSNATSAAGTLSPGQQAVTVAVDGTSGLGGLLNQGDRVDVLEARKGEVSAIAEDVRVIALDSKMTAATTKYSTVTLAVSEAQARSIRAAQSSSSVTLLLNPTSQGTSNG